MPPLYGCLPRSDSALAPRPAVHVAFGTKRQVNPMQLLPRASFTELFIIVLTSGTIPVYSKGCERCRGGRLSCCARLHQGMP